MKKFEQFLEILVKQNFVLNGFGMKTTEQQ